MDHPNYLSNMLNCLKWRLTKESGDRFIDKYLVHLSSRETTEDFAARKAMTPCPAYAKSSLMEIRNAIYVKMNEILRSGGPASYQRAVTEGIDSNRRSLAYFIGMEVLEELLALGRVGIYVDKASSPSLTKAQRTTPYVYLYAREQIRNWSYSPEGELQAVLLSETVPVTDDDGLTTGDRSQFRKLVLTPEGVMLTILDDQGSILEQMLLNLRAIPFAIAELSSSLLSEVANYQIALLNMESSDVSYAIRANFPFYVEQQAFQASDFVRSDPEIAEAKGQEIRVGVTSGRRYGKGLDAPQFIHPSPEPLEASMHKQNEMKATIRHLMHLTLATLKPMRESAESKDRNKDGLKAGLSYIGLELERLERQIATIWADYERAEPASVFYPSEYTLETDEDRTSTAERLAKVLPLPSLTYRRSIAAQIIRTMLQGRVPYSTLATAIREVEQAEVINLDPESVRKDVEAALVDHATASLALMYPTGSAAKAHDEHVQKLKEVAIAQSEASAIQGSVDRLPGTAKMIRGVDPEAGEDDKTNPDGSKKPMRGGAA